jgi:hypothetical protein
MRRKQFEKELKEALDAVNAVVKKYNPKNTYLSMCIIEDYISANNEYWDKDKKKGFDYLWKDEELVGKLKDMEGYKDE